MGPDKPSSFCNYYVEPYFPTLCGDFTFKGRMSPRAKTSSQEQGPDFYIVGTYKWLSYVSLRESSVWRVGQVLSLQGVYRFESSRHSRL
jgi:hypothetical protein